MDPFIEIENPEGCKPLISVKLSELGDDPTLFTVRRVCLV